MQEVIAAMSDALCKLLLNVSRNF